MTATPSAPFSRLAHKLRQPGSYAPLVGTAWLLPALALAFSAAWPVGAWWDNDINYIIALGRSILTGGLPWTDTLTCNDGLDCIAQQWLFCVVCALLYDGGGKAAVSALVLATWAAAAWAVYGACRAAGASRRTSSALCAAALLSSSVFVKTNPRGIDVACLMLSCRAVLEWLDGRGRRALLVPAACSAALANLHCTMWPVAAMPIACALVDPKTTGRRRELLLSFVLTTAASMCSPYGIWSTLYVFASMSGGLSQLGIGELAPLSAATSPAYFTVFVISSAAYAFLRARSGGGPCCQDALFALLTAMAFAQVRNGVLFWPVAATCFATLLRGRFEGTPCIGSSLARFSACVLLALGAGGLALIADDDGVWHEESRRNAVAAIGDAGVTPGSAVLNTFGSGGWLELAGYRPAYDERAELLLPQINGGHDLASEVAHIKKRYPDDLAKRIEPGKYRACVLDSYEVPYYRGIMAEYGYRQVYSDENLTAWVRGG